MQNTIFSKNILFLFPTDEDQHLYCIDEALKKSIKNIYRLNFVEYCWQNGIRNLEKYIMNLIIDKEIDIVMSFLHPGRFYLSVEFYASLKTKTNIVFWLFDDEIYFDIYSKHYCQVADAVVTADYFSVFAYKKIGIPAILHFSSFSKNIYHPVKVNKDIDVCFLGTCFNSRMEYINFLIENGIKVETFGIASKNGFAERSDFSKILSRSKINLNFTQIYGLGWMNKDNPLLNRGRQNKGRPIEIALTKSFCLSEYAPSLEFLFEIGKEIDVFRNKKELLEKVNYYLSNEDKREEIAKNAYKKAIDNYESDIYIPKLLKEIEEILEKIDRSEQEKMGIYLSKEFKINSINGLTGTIFILIKNKKLKYALEMFRELFKYGIFIFFIGFGRGLIRGIKNNRYP